MSSPRALLRAARGRPADRCHAAVTAPPGHPKVCSFQLSGMGSFQLPLTQGGEDHRLRHQRLPDDP